MEPTSEQLMAEMAWVRRLARALVRDDAAADDIAQDAFVVASEQRPSEDRPLRPWLATVVRNLVHTRRRGDVRRDARELAYDEGRRVATPQELAERVELQRVVAGEVLALAEPYRSTVLLHFVEGLPSADIARRLGIPDGTVRRRLKTALDQLRAALRAREDQPNRGWLAALVPLAKLPDPHIAAGVIVMKKLVAAAVLLLLLLAGTLVWRHSRASGDKPAALSAGATTQALRPIGDQKTVAVVPPWLAQPGVKPQRIAGKVVADGAPVAGATVRIGVTLDQHVGQIVIQPVGEVLTGADGMFDFGTQPAAMFTVSASAPDHAAAWMSVATADPKAKTDQIVLELGDCKSRLFGSVVDASGGGIAKARLFVAGLSGTEADASGHYSVCLVGEPSFGTEPATVRIEADGYGSTTQQVLLVGELRQDFLLVPEAVLVGRVVTSNDQPVPNARVIAMPDVIEGPHHVAAGWVDADGDGRFRIAGLAPGKFELSARSSQLTSAQPLIAIARPAKTSHELRVVVAPGARVRGHVVMDGKPVAGASVAVVRPRDQHPVSGISQADGSFVLEQVPFGQASVIALPYNVRAPKLLDIKAASLDNVMIEVSKSTVLRGRVTRKGQPIAGTDVECLESSGNVRMVKSDATGAYMLDGLNGGDMRCGALSRRAGAFANMRPVHVGAGEEQTLDFELDSAGEVKGVVVDETGKPVPGVYVRMDLEEDGSDDQCESMTDGTGAFDCPLLLGGPYKPMVAPSPGSRQAFAPAEGDRLATVTVPKDGAVTGVKLAIKYERMQIRGNVVDDTGAAMADVHVEAIGRMVGSMDLPSAMSDAGGHFTIDNLARGTYNLHAHAADGSETEILNIATGSDGVVIKLARPGAIEGTLVGFSTTPIVETNTLTADLHIGGNAIVDGNTFSQVGLPPGRYTVEAKVGGEVDGASVDVKSGETAHVTLRSRGTGKIEGTVSELGTKAPVAGMRCDANLSMGGQMSASPPDESLQAFTDAAGHFTLQAPVGRVRVFCFLPNGGPPLSVAGTDVDVTPGALPHVELFAVRSTFGQSPGNAGFNITPINLPLVVNQVDPHGPAAATGIASGDHVVSIDGISMQGLLPQGALFLLMNHRPGTTVTVVFERGGATHTVKITVVAS